MTINIAQYRRIGDTLYVSGQGPVEPGTMRVVGDDIVAQSHYTIDLIEGLLRENDAELTDVAFLRCFLVDPADFAGWNQAFAERFGAAPPARTTVVAGMVLPEMKLEIEVVVGLAG